jgi:rfaE bifunctional protein kinase chain/domain
MRNYLKEKIKSFQNKNIAVIGDIMLDRTEFGEVSKIVNPEDAKVPIINASEEFYLGGASNVARNISSYGANAYLFGVLGNDFYKHLFKELAEKGKIDIDNVVYINQPTIIKQRRFVNGRYDTRTDLGEKNIEKINSEVQEELLSNLEKNLYLLDGIILSDYNKHLFTKEFTEKIIRMSKRNVPVYSDFKPVNTEFFKGSYLISPNKKEAEEITGIKYDGSLESLEKIGKELSKKIGSRKSIITLGEEGAYYYSNKGGVLIPAHGNDVVEFTGAGDTFIATVALGRSSLMQVKTAVDVANYAAGIVVGKQGTATTNIEELIKAIEDSR